MTIDNQEYHFSSKIEQPIEGDGRKIKELESNDGWKAYLFEMDDNTEKILTADDIKNIIKDTYNYCIESITLKREDNTDFISGTCKAGNIIRVYVNLSINEDFELMDQSGYISDYTFDNVNISDNSQDQDNLANQDDLEDIEQESPYKRMIENQTGIISYGDRTKPELSLTIDDGDGYDNIKAILEILKEENIQATFFIKGNRLGGKNTELWKEAISQGHQICCHTYSHFYLNSEGDITSLTTGNNKKENDVNTWIANVKRLLGEDYYNNILKADELSKLPDTIRSDLLLETEILMREEEVRRTLGDEYLQTYKRDYPFIRLPGGHGLYRQKNIDVLKKLGYLSIFWSDDFLRKGKHQSIENMNLDNGRIPLFHFRGQTEQQYIRDYIFKGKENGKSFKPLTEIIKPE